MNGVDDEIRADFLTEAGELLDRLGEQLVDLERNPQDRELLNAVFRAFHTVKGGAGFLGLTNMVALCHIAEEVFGVVRAGNRPMTPDLMDATMQSLDQLISMMAEVSAGNDPSPAPASLLAALKANASTSPAPVAAAGHDFRHQADRHSRRVCRQEVMLQLRALRDAAGLLAAIHAVIAYNAFNSRIKVLGTVAQLPLVLERESIAQVRSLSRGLVPVSDRPDALWASLVELADRTNVPGRVECKFDSPVVLVDELARRNPPTARLR